MSPVPEANDDSVRSHEIYGKMFEASSIPEHVEGFELNDPEKIHEVWPEGAENAKEVGLPFPIREDSKLTM
jgi:hypothetical protein